MLRIVMLKPTPQLAHHRLRIRPMGQIGIVWLEGSNETLRRPVTLQAAHQRRRWLQHKLLGKRARLRRHVTAAIIGQPLRVPARLDIGAVALLNRLHHQVASKAGIDALSRGHPAHRFPVTVIQSRGDPHPLTGVEARFEPIQASARIIDIDGNQTIMPTVQHWLVTKTTQEQPSTSHHSVPPLMVCLPAIQLQHRPRASAAITGTIPGNVLDRLEQLSIIRPDRHFTPILPIFRSIQPLQQMAVRYTKGRAHSTYCSPPGRAGERAIHFFTLAKSTASLRISFYSVLCPSAASNCLMRFWAPYNSETDTTGSFARTATNDPSRHALRLWKCWLVLIPNYPVTRETDIPGSVVRLTQISFYSGLQRLRPCTPVIISIFEWPPKYMDIGIYTLAFLSVYLRNTDASVLLGS
jgi:hypothetical protein